MAAVNKCPKCGQSLPDGSVFCQYCGFKIETVDSAPDDSGEPTPVVSDADSRQSGNSHFRRKPKTKLKPVLWIVLAVVILGLGFCGYNYLRFTNALDNGQFVEANQYFKLIPFGNSIFVYFVTAIISIIGIELLTITVCSSNAFNEISRFICYCGTHTIAILCMHKFPVLVFQYVVPFTKDLLRATAESVGKNVVGLLLTVIVIGLCLIVEKPIERYCPIILGQKSYIAKR